MAWVNIFWIVMVFTRMDGASEHDGKALFKLLQPQVHQHEGNDGGSESGENDLVKERTSITEDDEPLDHSEYISNIYNSEDSEDLIARFKRQVSEEDIKQALCKDKNMGEFFRLVAGRSTAATWWRAETTASRPSDVPPASHSASGSRLATGARRWRTATRRRGPSWRCPST